MKKITIWHCMRIFPCTVWSGRRLRGWDQALVECSEKELIDLVREEQSAELEFLEVVELAFDPLGQGLALMLRLSSVQILE